MRIEIVGCGNVGSLVAYGCILHPTIRCYLKELNLIDIDEKKLAGEIADLTQMKEMIPICEDKKITSNPISESDIYVICAGKSNDDREMLYEDNSKIVREYLEKIATVRKENSILLMVTNPSGKLAQLALDYVPLVIPIGNLLDNARLRLCKATGKHEKPSIQSEYLKVKECKGYSSMAPATEVLIRILQYTIGFVGKENCF